MMLKRLSILVAFLLCPVFAYSAPSISDVTISGSTITLSGSGFGTKSTAAPIKWDNMENGSYDSNWGFIYMNLPSIITSNGRAGSTYHAEYDVTSTREGGPSWVNGVPEKDEIYLYYWAKKDWIWGTDGDTAYGNFKMNRVEHDVGGSNPNIYWGWGYTEYLASMLEYGTASDNNEFLDRETNWPDDTWVLIESYYKIDDSGNGIMEVWFNGKSYSRVADCDMNATAMDGMHIGVYNARSEGVQSTDRFYQDDIYFDNTRARVMLCATSTFDATQAKEIQIPTSWASTSISATFNQGAFGNGDTVYAFVVDSDGNVSGGEAVTIPGPTLSTTTISGSTITLTGTAFGAIASPVPLKSSDFEDGTNGTYLDDTDSDWVAYENNGAKYSNTETRSGSLSVFNDPFVGDFDTNYYTDSSGHTEMFCSYWFKVANAELGGGAGADYGIIKLSRLNSSTDVGGDGVYNGAGDFILSNMNPKYESYPNCSANNGAQILDNGSVQVPYNEWVQIQMYKKLSTAGDADGIIMCRSVGIAEQLSTSAVTRATGETFTSDTMWLGLAAANVEGDGFELYIDDVYFSDTRARVEVSKNSDGSGARELQLMTARSDTSITATVVNASVGDYASVVDEDGNRSAWVQITSDTPTPCTDNCMTVSNVVLDGVVLG